MYRAEYRKIIRFVPLWIYLGICLLFNIILTFNSGDVIYFNGMSSIAAEAGQKLDEKFISRLSSLQNNPYMQDALDIAENLSPLYENYDVDVNLTSYYADLVSSSQKAVSIRYYDSGAADLAGDLFQKYGSTLEYNETAEISGLLAEEESRFTEMVLSLPIAVENNIRS